MKEPEGYLEMLETATALLDLSELLGDVELTHWKWNLGGYTNMDGDWVSIPPGYVAHLTSFGPEEIQVASYAIVYVSELKANPEPEQLPKLIVAKIGSGLKSIKRYKECMEAGEQ